MSDVIFEDQYIRITPRTLEKGITSYPINKIVSVTQPLQLPFDFVGGFLVNGVLFLFGLWGMSHLTTGWLIGGGFAALVGGINVWGQFNRQWWITVEIVGTEGMRIQRAGKQEIDAIYAALRTAIEA